VRVLFVASSGERGGAELALATYLEHLPPDVEGHGLVLSPGPVAALLAERLGRPVAAGGLTGRPGIAQAVRFARGYAAELRRVRPDVVLATGIKAAMLCAPAARGVPTVWHKVDLSYDGRVVRPLALLTAGVIPVSEAAGAAVPASRRLAPVPPPVRLDPAFRVGADRPPATLGSVGRLVPYKGHADVIEAAARLPGASVVIAGGRDPSAPGHADELRALAAARGVAVELLGHVDRVERVYERLTVLVQATYRDDRGFGGEGFGMSVAEAAWAGVPAVATSGGADAYAARVVPARDPAAIAAAVAAVAADPAAAAEASRRARADLAPARLAGELVSALRAAAARAAA